MDETGIAIVKSTFQAASPMADLLSRVFYDRLFELDPSLRTMFPADLGAQRQKLMDELVAIVDSLDRLHELVARTTDLGSRHAGYGVEPRHYDLVLDALLHALSTCVPDAMTPTAVVAWRRAYHLIAETMMHGAAHGPSTPRTSGPPTAGPSTNG
jgi:hemoglobin-like flavoprotein